MEGQNGGESYLDTGATETKLSVKSCVVSTVSVHLEAQVAVGIVRKPTYILETTVALASGLTATTTDKVNKVVTALATYQHNEQTKHDKRSGSAQEKAVMDYYYRSTHTKEKIKSIRSFMTHYASTSTCETTGEYNTPSGPICFFRGHTERTM